MEQWYKFIGDTPPEGDTFDCTISKSAWAVLRTLSLLGGESGDKVFSDYMRLFSKDLSPKDRFALVEVAEGLAIANRGKAHEDKAARCNGKNFSEKLSELMAERSETRYRLAKELCCSQSTVASWLRGSTSPSRTMKRAIAEHYGVPVEELYDTENTTT